MTTPRHLAPVAHPRGAGITGRRSRGARNGGVVMLLDHNGREIQRSVPPNPVPSDGRVFASGNSEIPAWVLGLAFVGACAIGAALLLLLAWVL